jgi:uncharacterized protein YifE (UPF0438 family)
MEVSFVPGVVLVLGMTLRYVQVHGHPAELDGMPSLTQREQDLLHRYQRFYLDLVEGRRLPETDAQRRFFEVAAGRLPPMTEHERLWVRWRREIRDRNVRAVKRRLGPDEPSGRPAVTGHVDAQHHG